MIDTDDLPGIIAIFIERDGMSLEEAEQAYERLKQQVESCLDKCDRLGAELALRAEGLSSDFINCFLDYDDF